MKHRVLRGALVVYAAFALAPSAPSTILIRQDLADLLKNSEAVVRATIVGGEARWDAERRMIWTTTTFDVTETWKGTTTGRSSLRELGGVVGNVGMRVVGAPQYAAGEDVILFLYRDALGFTRTTGWTPLRLRRPRKARRRARDGAPRPRLEGLLRRFGDARRPQSRTRLA
jgi:hypothetical protein